MASTDAAATSRAALEDLKSKMKGEIAALSETFYKKYGSLDGDASVAGAGVRSAAPGVAGVGAPPPPPPPPLAGAATGQHPAPRAEPPAPLPASLFTSAAAALLGSDPAPAPAPAEAGRPAPIPAAFFAGAAAALLGVTEEPDPPPAPPAPAPLPASVVPPAPQAQVLSPPVPTATALQGVPVMVPTIPGVGQLQPVLPTVPSAHMAGQLPPPPAPPPPPPVAPPPAPASEATPAVAAAPAALPAAVTGTAAAAGARPGAEDSRAAPIPAAFFSGAAAALLGLTADEEGEASKEPPPPPPPPAVAAPPTSLAPPGPPATPPPDMQPTPAPSQRTGREDWRQANATAFPPAPPISVPAGARSPLVQRTPQTAAEALLGPEEGALLAASSSSSSTKPAEALPELSFPQLDPALLQGVGGAAGATASTSMGGASSSNLPAAFAGKMKVSPAPPVPPGVQASPYMLSQGGMGPGPTQVALVPGQTMPPQEGLVDPMEKMNQDKAAMAQQEAAAAAAAAQKEAVAAQEAAAAQQAALEQMTPEQQMAVYAAMSAAGQAQLMQQCQFYDQLRAHEAERLAKGGFFLTQPARFKDGYRPLRLCKHYTTVGCWRDEECTYAHSFEELHPASPDLPRMESGAGTNALAEQTKVEDTAPDVRLKKKRELCRKFQNNECVLGRACPYAHGEKELGTVELVVCGRVKTRICKFWASGNCMFSGNCVNAHGEQELGTKRPDFITPPMKKRREGESIDAFREQVIAKPVTKFGPGPLDGR